MNSKIDKESNNSNNHPSDRFLDTPPFYYSDKFAKENDCDLAALSGDSIGNILVFSRLVEEYALSIGRPIKLLTAPINLLVGVIKNEEKYPVWKYNPFISEIVNAEEINKGIIGLINREQDNYCQFNHMIENICSVYNLRPRKLKPSIFLSQEEMQWGLETLSHLPRPVIAIHPSGKSSVNSNSKWYYENWEIIIKEFYAKASFVEISKFDYDKKELSTFSIPTSIRQAMSLIWASDIFIGFDSAPAHIATAFDKPALVLWNILRKNELEEPFQEGFGPASLLRWSYPQNRNIMLLGERNSEILNLIIEYL
ncbi:glycosyltransferase family 9 protein [Emticicia sp. TH156]|uniref:glycosyltransferase family 9 protein n=1 Tax=Emticicia sp. TH156 TaxID=2067454 RepID=UPI000C760244|nr:glycosyltransferase family 9 protein [Emticicia sp. TH156]PLK42182.1 hypothetical protein C0V77_22310 [Emticicia sp. TH156]